jgi:OOP family OmpA-OmpF porin
MKLMSMFTIFLLAGVAAMGCANPELQRAEQSYSEARDNPMIAQHASGTLDEAGRELTAARDARTWTAQDQHAYMAQKNVELARVQASGAQSSTRAAELQQEQAQLLASLQRQQAEQARMEAEKSRQGPQAYMGEGSVQTMPSRVLFGFNKAQLKPGAEGELNQLSDFLHKNPDRQVLIEGFTDSIGSSAYNQQLSQRRAEAVANALSSGGISADRIISRGEGEKYPVDTNKTAAGRQQNRRVEITVLNPGQRPEEAGRGKGRM